MKADLRIDYLKLRHGDLARLLRHVLCRVAGGRESWPIIFAAPAPDQRLPLGFSPHLYVHLPFCESLCPHCPYNKVLIHRASTESYGRALMRELRRYLESPGAMPIASLYFGGGTPSATLNLIEAVINEARPHLETTSEVGVEVHPSDATPPLLERLVALGVNRISLGVETLNSDLLRMLGRRYSPGGAQDATRAARSAGFECLDVNLIYGIPGQDERESARDAARLLALGIDQVSAYPLFGFAHSPLVMRERGGRYPAYGERARLTAQRAISRECQAAGLERTSVWSFTRVGIAPYSTVTKEDYVGFGAGAGSKVGEIFWFNTFSVGEYSDAPDARPALVMKASPRLRRLHWLYWSFYRTHIRPDQYSRLFGRSFKDDFGHVLRLLRLAGWLEGDGDGWRVTERGAIFGHRLQSLFSLSYIDEVWRRCQGEAWPSQVVLS